MSKVQCCFCHSSACEKVYQNLYHNKKSDHGPFDFFECQECGSGITFPLPSSESLGELYASFQSGLPDEHRELMKDQPQTAWYQWCLNRMLALSGKTKKDSFSWIEVGAGGGEMSFLLSQQAPNSHGIGLDLHSKPAILTQATQVEWQKLDLNSENFADTPSLNGKKADIVFATAVWEHVLKPDSFVRNLLRLLAPGGTLYLVCPDYSSAARRFLGTKWPYFTPGEHLNMPTLVGARACLKTELENLGYNENNAYSLDAKRVGLPYTIGYVLSRIGLAWLVRVPIISQISRLAFPMPAGALEATVQLRKDAGSPL
jgi:SAM-dependent methyltransferase